jgi:hypothetical protein
MFLRIRRPLPLRPLQRGVKVRCTRCVSVTTQLTQLTLFTAPNPSNPVAPAAPLPRYGSSFLLDAVQSFRREEVTAGSPRDELRLYLESGTESTDNVIAWWGVSYFY